MKKLQLYNYKSKSFEIRSNSISLTAVSDFKSTAIGCRFITGEHPSYNEYMFLLGAS